MATRARHVRQALWLSAFSVAWSGIVGSIPVYVALAGGALSLLGFGVDAVIDAAASGTLIWRFTAEAGQAHPAARVDPAAGPALRCAVIPAAYVHITRPARAS